MQQFYKFHGIGNDYIYFDCFGWAPKRPAVLARKLCDRHFSIGGDGVVLILPSKVADAKMRMYNADGSEGLMCGNAIRCVAKYLYDFKGLRKRDFTIETASGVHAVHIVSRSWDKEHARLFTVDMGKPLFAPIRVPANIDCWEIIDHPLTVGDTTYAVTCLSMGNPHCVVFTDDLDALDLGTVGPLFEKHPVFPEGVNTEFVRAIGPCELSMRVWERGSGETLACGTGACAAAVAAVRRGICKKNEEITVHLKGGDLRVLYTGRTVFLLGPAEFAFSGSVEI